MYHFLLFAFLATQLSAHSLMQAWEQEKSVNAEFSIQNDLLKGKHVLFVAGVMNELASLISSYFTHNIEATSQLGATTELYNPQSSASIPSNADQIYAKILESSQRERRTITLVGHSKGGAETFYAILKHPELILNGIVERVILIQAAIGGSPLALKSSIALDCVSIFVCPNMQTLRPDVTKIYFDYLLNDLQSRLTLEQRKYISDRIYYVRADESPDHLSFGIKLVLNVLGSNLNEFGPNDGLLPVDAQLDTRIGTDLGILKSDHIGLTISTVSNIGANHQKAFTRALFKQVVIDTGIQPDAN